MAELCISCSKYYANEGKRKMCSECFSDWCREQGHPISANKKEGFFTLNEINKLFSKIINGQRNQHEMVTRSCSNHSMSLKKDFLLFLKNRLSNKDYKPQNYIQDIIWQGEMLELKWDEDEENISILKFFTAQQAKELLDYRKKKCNDGDDFWKWEHVIFFLVGDHWNISTEYKVGYCYYADWGSFPRKDYANTSEKLKNILLNKMIGRARMALNPSNHRI